jgi:chemotaxis signal transduction protein
VNDVFQRLRQSVVALEHAISEGVLLEQLPAERVLRDRTDRIAREPHRIERAPDTLACMVFERSGRRYAVPLTSLSEVGTLGPVAHVPGVPDAYLGVAARRGRVVSIIDLPRLFGAAAGPTKRPDWLVMVASREVVCGVGADELHDVIDVRREGLARAMPTFPALLQRHALGVLEDRTVVLDLSQLLEDRTLRVEERHG